MYPMYLNVAAVVVMVVVAGHGASAEYGSCAASRKCCDGKDTDCVVQKADINSIIEDLTDEPCYCDHGCLEMGDCCPDFKDYCGGRKDWKIVDSHPRDSHSAVDAYDPFIF